MKYWSASKTFILCQLPDKHSFQGQSQLILPSIVDLLHSASHCSSLLTCGSTTLSEMWIHQIQDFPFRSVPHLLTVAYRAIHSLHFPHLWVHYTVNQIIPLHMWVCYTVRIVSPSTIAVDKIAFQCYQNSLNSGS